LACGRIWPIYAGILGISMFSSLGLPGLNGFIGEFMVFKGRFPACDLLELPRDNWSRGDRRISFEHDAEVCFESLNPKWKDLADLTRGDLHRRGADVFHVCSRRLSCAIGQCHQRSREALVKSSDMNVAWTIYSTFIGAGLVLLLPREAKTLIRWVALLTGVIGLCIGLNSYFEYNAWVKEGNAGFWQIADIAWIPTLGARYHLRRGMHSTSH